MNLINIRKKNKYSQKEVAKKINVSQGTYSKYENGIADPTVDTLIKLADLFHTSVDNLIRDNKDEISNNQHPRYSDNLIEKIKQLNEYNLMKVEGYVENMLEEQNRRTNDNNR